jgi:uncharacterized protein YjbJ (UPF0337 family)
VSTRLLGVTAWSITVSAFQKEVSVDNRKKDDSVAEEVSAFGQRVKGAAKDVVGDLADDRGLEREGERENAMGRARQQSNDVLDETDGVRGSTASSTPAGSPYVSGLYRTPEDATRAYSDLTTKHSYGRDDIDVVMSDETRKRHFGDVTPGAELSGGTKAAEGLGAGSMIGGGIGAALAAIFAVGSSVVVPGIGLVVAGPIAAALAGAGAGGATGGLIGALIGAGIPEDRAKEYERGIHEGGIVVGTRARDAQHAAELERDFASYGGSDIRR